MKFLFLTTLLALLASARADPWFIAPSKVDLSGSSAPSITLVPYIEACADTPTIHQLAKPFTVIAQGSTYGPGYAGSCLFSSDEGATWKYCSKAGFSVPILSFGGGTTPPLGLTYTPTTPGLYRFYLLANPTGAVPSEDAGKDDYLGSAYFKPSQQTTINVQPSTCGGCPGGPGTCNDPIITGFDGSTFHFDEVGEYVMLESGDGYKVHSTFAGATAANSDLEVMERSWTSSVRLFSPNGDMVSCSLPAIVPNTSRLQVTAVSASGATMLSMDKQSLELAEMSATVLLSEGDGPKHVAGCILSTPKMDLRVDQVSGYEQATKFPETEAWAAPFTWLNAGFTVKKPLASPVTGILGATYPAEKVAEQYALAAGSDAAKTSARMDGEGPGPKTHRRALAAQPVPFLPVSSNIVGLSS